MKRTRIVLEDGDSVRALLAVHADHEGGLMIDLCAGAPVDYYRYGVVDLPAGEGPVVGSRARDETTWTISDVAPKLHYHRSGYLSLNATGTLPRQGIQITKPLDIEETHRHVFSLVMRHPFSWPAAYTTECRSRLPGVEDPTTLTLAGFVGPITNLKPEQLATNPWGAVLEGDDGLVPTVVAVLGSGEESCYLWVELHPTASSAKAISRSSFSRATTRSPPPIPPARSRCWRSGQCRLRTLESGDRGRERPVV